MLYVRSTDVFQHELCPFSLHHPTLTLYNTLPVCYYYVYIIDTQLITSYLRRMFK